MLRKVVLGLLMSLMISSVAYASQWVQQGEDWYYQEDDGSFAKNKVIDGYYVAYNGRMINSMEVERMRGIRGLFDMVYHASGPVKDSLGYAVYPYKDYRYMYSCSSFLSSPGSGCRGLVAPSITGLSVVVSDIDELKTYFNRLNEIIVPHLDRLLTLDEASRAVGVGNIVRSVYTYDASTRWQSDYETLKTGIGCCTHYAQLCSNLCNMVGIDCEYVHFDQYDHDINLITINGQRYWFDTTPTSTMQLIPVGSGSRYDSAEGWLGSGGNCDVSI